MPPPEPRDFVAGYAAIVATASLVWQVWNSYRAKRPQVFLLLDTWRSSQAGKRVAVQAADIRVRNRDEYTIRIERLYFRYRFPQHFFSPAIPAEIEGGDVSGLPFEVPAREVVSLTIRPSQTYGWSVTSGEPQNTPEVVMELRTGERYVSRATR